ILEKALAHCGQEVARRTRDKVAAQAQLETAQVHVAQLATERDAGRGAEERRAALTTRIVAAREAYAKAVATLSQDRGREAARLKKLTVELHEARSLARERRTTLAKRREEAKAALNRKPAIVAASEQ